MRILLLNLYFPPDTSATAKMARTVAEALAAHHQVTVLCGRPSYDPAERRHWRFSRTEQAGRVRVIRVGSTDYPRFRMKLRVLNYLTYVALAVPRALFIPADAVLAMTDPPFEGIVGAFVALLKRRPCIYNIRDMYPDMAVGGSIVPPGLLTRLWEKLHRWALRRAACVIVLGEDMRARIISKAVDPSRVEIVRDGAEILPPGALPPALDEHVVRAIRGNARLVLLHAGNLGFYGAWDTLLAAAHELADDGVDFVFVGDGAQRSRLQTAAADLNNVRFLDFFPASKIPSVLAAADAHIITVKRGLEGVVVPSKMYGILAAGKPIIAVAPGESDAVALGLRQGFSVSANPDDPAELIGVARRLLRNQEDLRNMSAAALAAAPAYDRASELQRFARIVADIAGRETAGRERNT